MNRALITLTLAALPALLFASVSAAPLAPATATAPAIVPASAVESAPASAPAPASTDPATAASAASATAPSTAPTTLSTTAPATAPATATAAATATEPAAERRYGRSGNGGSYATRSLPPDYEVLNRKSIFSKDRTRASDRGGRGFDRGVSFPRAAQPPVFIGTVLEDDGFVGFIESPDSGQLLQIHRGDKLPNGAGSVAELTLDYLEIAPDPASPQLPPKRIVVGQTLLGAAPVLPAASTEPSGAEGAATTTAPASSGAADSLIERLRRRRQQELGK
jgi:hypothetical protein